MTTQPSINSTLKMQLASEIQQDQIAKVVVGAFIKKGEEILLLERLPTEEFGNLVELPSGTVEANEQLDAALIREIAEETSLNVISFGHYIGSFDYISGLGKSTRQLNFEVTVQEGEIILQPTEHKAFYWVNPSSEIFQHLKISNEIKKIIQAGLSSIVEPH